MGHRPQDADGPGAPPRDLKAAYDRVVRELQAAEGHLAAQMRRVTELQTAEAALFNALYPSRASTASSRAPHRAAGTWSAVAQLEVLTPGNLTIEGAGGQQPSTSVAVLTCLQEAGRPLTVDELMEALLSRRWLRRDVVAPRDMIYRAAARLARTRDDVHRVGRGCFVYTTRAPSDATPT